MALIDLKTNLKDLKFGNDELGGGNSGQPYVQTPIPAADEALPLGTGGPDFLVRGGTLLPVHIADDEKRLAKFFKSTNGLLFIAKQNLLSRVAVRTQVSTGLLNEGTYTPISTLLEAAGNPLGIHVNKQGLNPFDSTFYAAAVKDIREPLDNRLARLKETVINRKDFSVTFGKFTLGSTTNIDVLSYQGGPDSVLGIGKTHIRFATNNVGVVVKTSNKKNIDTDGLNVIATLTPEQFEEVYKTAQTRLNLTVDFRETLKELLNSTKYGYPKSPSYDSGDKKTIETRTQIGDPGNSYGKNLKSYVTGDESIKIYKFSKNSKKTLQPGGGTGAASLDSHDMINSSGPSRLQSPTDPPYYKDLVDFRIGVINNDNPSVNRTTIYFRAFLDNISDQYTSNWDPTRYIGRGENFYTYAGFDRKVSLSWTVAAQSKIELMQMYRRLNYLASVCAPDYSSNGYMRGNIVELTIGGYFYQQPGIITGLNYEMNEDNDSWEIAINDEGNEDTTVKQLPHIIRVKGFNFIPIHTFAPSIQSINDDQDIIVYGNQRYIALENSRGTNWDMSGYPK